MNRKGTNSRHDLASLGFIVLDFRIAAGRNLAGSRCAVGVALF
jgi:hypothetical protein